MKRVLTHISRMSDSAKIDLMARALFGDVDDETLAQTPGLIADFADLRKSVRYIMYGGAFASAIVVMHFLGVPTQIIWGLASKATAAVLH